MNHADIEDADIIFAATNDPEINNAIRLQTKKGQLLLQVDDAKKGDFHCTGSCPSWKTVHFYFNRWRKPKFNTQIKKGY